MLGEICERVSVSMHIALDGLRKAPCSDVRDNLADVLNVVGLTVQGNPRFVEEHEVIDHAGRLLNDYIAPAPLPEDALVYLKHAVNVIDTILGKLDLNEFRSAERSYVALARAARRAAHATPVSPPVQHFHARPGYAFGAVPTQGNNS
ncbi:hypothetical protein RAN3_2497 [plant metagenome]|uniref:Uncharacterized protein n=1 Tax=plant metagenome TaxID=1297885 RepID=A0A484U3P5_9ZZZZ